MAHVVDWGGGHCRQPKSRVPGCEVSSLLTWGAGPPNTISKLRSGRRDPDYSSPGLVVLLRLVARIVQRLDRVPKPSDDSLMGHTPTRQAAAAPCSTMLGGYPTLVLS